MNDVKFFDFFSLQPQSGESLKGIYEQGMGLLFFGQDMGDIIGSCFDLNGPSYTFVGENAREKLQLKLDENPEGLSRNGLINVVGMYEKQYISGIIDLLRDPCKSNMVWANCFLFLCYDDISHLPWKPYIVRPRWRGIDLCGPRDVFILTDNNEDRENELERVLNRPTQLIEDSQNYQNILTSIEARAKSLWSGYILRHLTRLAKRIQMWDLLEDNNVEELINVLGRYLPKLNSMNEGDSIWSHTLKTSAGREVSAIHDLGRNDILLLLEGFLTPHQTESGRLIVRLPNPLIAYLVAKAIKQPEPFPYTKTLVEFYENYDLSSYEKVD